MTETKRWLSRVKIKGFRSFAEVTFEPSRVDLLIGPNGAGKSNLLQLLRMMAMVRTQSLGLFVARDCGLREALKATDPEEINCGNTTAPSKRLQQAKVNHGKLTRGVPAVHAAGIAKLCKACPRFRIWIRKLEKL